MIDCQDKWQYQNFITREWHYWRTIYKKQHNSTEWRGKWLNIPPTSSLGVIVYLSTRYDLHLFNRSLCQLSRLLSNNPQLVVIFHEDDLGDNTTQRSLAHTLGGRARLGFKCINFLTAQKHLDYFLNNHLRSI